METSITNGIQISVKPSYSYDNQDYADKKSLFTYEITIVNHSPLSVQLLERHWVIFDSIAGIREINGPGVIGKQPILESKESFSYTSWCPLDSEIGFMEGTYTMKNLDDGTYFEVRIPRFLLLATHRLN